MIHWSIGVFRSSEHVDAAVTSKILIGYVLSDAHFDSLIRNVTAYQENLF